MTPHAKLRVPSSESGFTLVEALIAVVVLMVGIMAVTNLMLVAASSNSVANQSTAAAATATQVLETFRSAPWVDLVPGGSLETDTGAGGLCQDLGTTLGPTALSIPNTYFCESAIPGVGLVRTRWQISTVVGTGRLLFVEVRSEGTGAFGSARTRAYFTTFRACTDSRDIANGCPTT